MEGEVEQKLIKVIRGGTLEKVAKKITSWLPPSENMIKLELVLIELLSNAVYYGIRNEPPDRKDTWNHDFTLSSSEAIQIEILKDSKKFAISIIDKGGKLKKQDVLYWLNRQISKDDSGLPLGILDSHGRGFFIVRKHIDRLLINIDSRKKTEIIIINYLNDLYSGYKPLYINEI